MQTDYLFHGIKGFERFAYYCYRYDMVSKEAQKRYKIVLFYEKFRLEATLEAFEISKRTLYRYQALLKKGKNKIESLESKSKAPKHRRKSTVPREIILEIQKVSNGIRRYIMTLIDPNSRIAFAVAIPSKHTARVLEALIDGLTGTIEINKT